METTTFSLLVYLNFYVLSLWKHQNKFVNFHFHNGMLFTPVFKIMQLTFHENNFRSNIGFMTFAPNVNKRDFERI